MLSTLTRSLLAVVLIAGFATHARAEEKEKFGRLTADEVEKRLGEKNLYLFDNNQREHFDEGHLPGARWVDYSHVTAADLPADKGATLIFYCANEH